MDISETYLFVGCYSSALILLRSGIFGVTLTLYYHHHIYLTICSRHFDPSLFSKSLDREV